MKELPLVSVVMSVFNAENYLRESIESILNQTFINFEFIIINDGSTDDSDKIIKAYSGKDSRIIHVSRENMGLPRSLNQGVALSKGKYIARMDADDISLPERLFEQVLYMESNLTTGVCGTWAEKIGDVDKKSFYIYPNNNKKLKSYLLFSVCFVHPTVMIRKEILIDNDLSYSDLFTSAQDYELWERLSRITDFYNVSKVLLKYRVLASSLSSVANKSKSNNRFNLISSVNQRQLFSLGVTLEHDEVKLHYDLILNLSTTTHNYSLSAVNKHFDMLLKSNLKSHFYENKHLVSLLALKYFYAVYFLRKKNDEPILKRIMKSLFFIGVKEFITLQVVQRILSFRKRVGLI